MEVKAQPVKALVKTESHLRTLRFKLNVETRMQLVLTAQGIIPLLR